MNIQPLAPHRFARPAMPLIRRTGVRLALIQALVLIGVVGLALALGFASERVIARNAIKDRVLGEVSSLEDEFAKKGAAHLPHTVNKRSRLWRGFNYRLTGPDGKLKAGTLSTSPRLGWALVGAADGNPKRRFYAYTERLPDGSLLTVGQNLSVETKNAGALMGALLLCGGLGVGLGFGASLLFMMSTWRRLSAMAGVARAVSAGHLNVRVPAVPHQPRDDIDELAGAFNVMLAEIALLVEQVREVSIAIAHDLRTPLSRVKRRIDRLRDDSAKTPRLVASVDEIDAELDEVLRSFDAMLRLAEIESSVDSSTMKRAELSEIALHVVGAFRPDIEAGGRAINAHVVPAYVLGDETLLCHALANLIENAMRHTPEGTPIEVGVEVRADKALMSVADHGPGVPIDKRLAVLQRFRRLDASRSGSGSGLGLAIVAAIAKRHGAQLSLQDARPGLKVELEFPRV